MLAGQPPSSLSEPEPPLRRDRATVFTWAVLLTIAAGAWAFVISSSIRSHEGMAMEGTPSQLFEFVGFVVSWAVMMAAMMLPSALPMIALYGATQRNATGSATQGVPVAVFTLVYLAVWATTGVPVYLASLFANRLAAETVPYGVAVVLVVAGGYQWSPLKHVCLRACRSPLGFLLGHWRAGRRGSVALGWAHATYCLGCCWALMMVLVAAGAMGVHWVLLVAAIVTAEKLLPAGEWTARATGAALVLLGIAVAIRPDLVTVLRAGHAM
jgi:predicted metal-binding membrane protein